MRKFDMFISLNAAIEITDEEYDEFMEHTESFVENEIKNGSNRISFNFVQRVGCMEIKENPQNDLEGENEDK